MSEVIQSADVDVRPATNGLRGTISVPGDKSLAHRAVLLNACASGVATVRGLPTGQDVASTVQAVYALGAGVRSPAPGEVVIEGRALSFREPDHIVDCGNSGTTMRLLAGVLAGQGFSTTLDGDASLRRRPMERVAGPLRELGALIESTSGRPPITVGGGGLRGTSLDSPYASAQVKSAVILAALQAEGPTEFRQPQASRDHTERMLRAMGVRLEVEDRGRLVRVSGSCIPSAVSVDVAGDPSSAAYFVVAALVVPGSDVTIDGVCLNPGRVGFLRVLTAMGGRIAVIEDGTRGGEPVGRIRVETSDLRAFELGPEDVPDSIDELPLLAVAASFAHGVSTIRGAEELRVKESDRIAGTVRLLRALGATARELEDGLEVEGGPPEGGGPVDPAGDHRLVMSAAVAALAGRVPTKILDPGAAAISYPEFFETLEGLRV